MSGQFLKFGYICVYFWESHFELGYFESSFVNFLAVLELLSELIKELFPEDWDVVIN
jgi:hypothetical protein